MRGVHTPVLYRAPVSRGHIAVSVHHKESWASDSRMWYESTDGEAGDCFSGVESLVLSSSNFLLVKEVFEGPQ